MNPAACPSTMERRIHKIPMGPTGAAIDRPSTILFNKRWTLMGLPEDWSRTTSAIKKPRRLRRGFSVESVVLTTSSLQHETTRPGPLLAGLLQLGRELEQEGHAGERS